MIKYAFSVILIILAFLDLTNGQVSQHNPIFITDFFKKQTCIVNFQVKNAVISIDVSVLCILLI